VASPALAARSAPLLTRRRDSDGDGACRLLGTVTMARQLTSQMLAETRQTSKRLSRTRRRGCGRREPAARSAPTARGTAPTATSGRRAPPARMGRAAIAREPAEGPARADADPVRHRGSCPGGNDQRTRATGPSTCVRAPRPSEVGVAPRPGKHTIGPPAANAAAASGPARTRAGPRRFVARGRRWRRR
jgi:hypothetical protein